MCFTFTLTDTRSVTRRRFTTASATRMIPWLDSTASKRFCTNPQQVAASRDPRHRLIRALRHFLSRLHFWLARQGNPNQFLIYGGRTIELFCMMIVLPALMIRLRISQSHFPSEAFIHAAPGRLKSLLGTPMIAKSSSGSLNTGGSG